MSILSDTTILAAIKAGDIVIDPFDREALGSNSYDVRLAKTLAVHVSTNPEPSGNIYMDVLRKVKDAKVLDAKQEPAIRTGIIPPEGLILEPGILYLGVTQEYTETHAHVPSLDGKSSIGRLGISIHVTAGKGDVGFAGHWTMEIFVIEPVRVYPGMKIGQLTYFTVDGVVERPYGKKGDAKYQHGRQAEPKPQPSACWKNFVEGK